jgi:transcriptional regulator with XRE-family HTH domain
MPIILGKSSWRTRAERMSLPAKHLDYDVAVTSEGGPGEQRVEWTDEAINALYVAIGARVREARKRCGWNQADLASAVNLTRSSIANFEAGRQRPPVHVALLIAKVLDTPMETLLPPLGELDGFANTQRPALDLEGRSPSTLDFVTAAVRRATGG